jgi:hypothetical protein
VADSTAIAIVSVSVAGITALAAPVLTTWLEERRETRRFRRERRMRDIAELRALLDDALVAFDEVFASRAELTKRWMLRPLAECTPLIQDVQAKRNRTVALKARLETRLGRPHPVTKAYDEAIERLDEAVAPLVAAHVEAAMGGGLATRPAPEVRTAAAAVIKLKHREMNAAMDRFTGEAQKLAGFQLEP